MYKIADINGEIVFVGGPGSPDVAGANNALYPRSGCGEVAMRMNFYKIENGACVQKTAQEISDIQAVIDADKLTHETRLASIEAALANSAFKGITIEQAETWIDNQVDTTALDSNLSALNAAVASTPDLQVVKDIIIQLRLLILALKKVDKKQLPGILPVVK